MLTFNIHLAIIAITQKVQNVLVTIDFLECSYHGNTSKHNKEVIQKSMQDADGIVRIVFATIALGMGVNMIAQFGTIVPPLVWMTICKRVAGVVVVETRRCLLFFGGQWMLHCTITIGSNAEVAVVRHYLENTFECRRVQLLRHFDLVHTPGPHDQFTCYDVCAQASIYMH